MLHDDKELHSTAVVSKSSPSISVGIAPSEVLDVGCTEHNADNSNTGWLLAVPQFSFNPTPQPIGKKYDTADAFFVSTAGRLHTIAFALEDEVLPAKPVIVCSVQSKVIDVLRQMIEHDIIAVPVQTIDIPSTSPTGHSLDHSNRPHHHHWHGFIDMWDIARYVVQHFSKQTLGERERSFWELTNEEYSFQDKIVLDVQQYPLRAANVFHSVTAAHSAFSICETMALDKLGRIPIIRSALDRRVIRFITQKQVVSWLNAHLHLIGAKSGKLLNSCPELYHAILCVKYDDIAIDAFELMVKHNVSGVAVINAEGRLVNHLSIGDLKLIGADASMFWRLQQSVRNFTRKLAAVYAHKYQRPRHVVYATPSATIEDVSHCLVNTGYHRLYIVDNHVDRRPVGVCSLSDFIYQIVVQ